MAKVRRSRKKSIAQDIIKTLLDSEIPEIRTIISELVECTRQLEERSQKLQNYATKIQELTGEEVEIPAEGSLDERLERLEKVLTELGQRAPGLPPKLEVKEVKEEVSEAPVPRPGRQVFYTPEGFVIRKRP